MAVAKVWKCGRRCGRGKSVEMWLKVWHWLKCRRVVGGVVMVKVWKGGRRCGSG